MEILKWAVRLILISAPITYGYSQPSHFTKNDHWKSQRKEIFFGAGPTAFLGDIGGRDTKGQHFSPMDYDANATRFAIHAGFRWRLASHLSTKTVFQYVHLYGHDKLTHYPRRRNRNVYFRTHVFETSQHFEFIIARKEEFGRRHRRAGLKGISNKNFQIYLFTGLSFYLYNPQGKGGEYDWTDLRPLHTEGQGLEGGPGQYQKYTFGIPAGLGYRIGLGNVWRMSFELSWSQSFTDYLDDVSGTYYNNDAIRDAYGDKAAYFADPSLEPFPEWTAEGEDRGDANHKDGYYLFNISLIRNLSYESMGKYKRKQKRRRRKLRRRR